jgi:hypothetical protein
MFSRPHVVDGGRPVPVQHQGMGFEKGLAGTIAALAALAVFQGVFNGLLISLIAMLLLSPERVEMLRRWVGRLRP